MAEYDPIVTEGPLASTVSSEDNFTRYRQLRLNYYATILLKARIYLWAGDTENALIEARKLTDDPQVRAWFPAVDPNTLLGNTVNPDRTFSTECLFGFYDSGRNTIFTSNFDAANLTSSSLLQPRTSYLSLLFTNAGDYRYQSQWSANTFQKYKGIELTEEENEDGTYPFYTYFMPLMHLSEAYYIAAECLMNSDLSQARVYLNTILADRGATLVPENVSATNFLNEIKNEYMREMWGEGQIFYMYKRFYQVITGVYDANSTGGTNPSTTIYVLPLPESELINR